ncbi:MAG: methionine adenosyltransferase [Acidobacteria bacterium]|nr:methionine adenosyltransferase [Acidobacteriota bacterium]
MNRIYIEQAQGLKTSELEVEIVERKGTGHPDTVCDGIMENVSQALSKAYLEQAGGMLHYNCDKALLIAGRAEHRWGGGRILEPMRLILGDRATSFWAEQKIDVESIAIEAAKGWVRKNLRHVDPDRHLHYEVELKPGSEALADLYRRADGVIGANDTSAAVGYAPLSETERLVLETERYLNSESFKKQFAETGEDVKVMGVRTGRSLHLTVAMPLIERYLESERKYFGSKARIYEAVLAYLQSRLDALDELKLRLNPIDRPGVGLVGIYSSVLGTSAEDADSGEVGRGNRVNGLISFNRPAGSEAAAGKNPMSHVGKIYNVLAYSLAHKLQTEIRGLEEVIVWLCSQIGKPVDQPEVVYVQGHLNSGVRLSDVSGVMHDLVTAELARMPVFCRELTAGLFQIG